LNSEIPAKSNIHRQFRKASFGTDRFILVQRSKLHYVEAGQGPPVILLPGSFTTARIWKRLMPLLADNYRLLDFDELEPGDLQVTGSLPASRVKKLSDIVAQIVRQLNLGQVSVIGGSYSGVVAFDFAARYPELTFKIVSIAGPIIAPGGSGTRRKAAGPNLGEIAEESKSIKVPILYLYGTKTNLKEIPLPGNIEYLQKYHPQAWIVGLEGGIFEIAVDRPQEIAALVLDFLKAKQEPRKE